MLWALTMIDPATGWFGMISIVMKQSDVISNKLEQTWLTQYPWPTQIVLNCGTEFMAEVTKMLKKDYRIILKPIKTQNPHANAILERAHQRIGNILCKINNTNVNTNDPWSEILSAVIFSMSSMVHTTM